MEPITKRVRFGKLYDAYGTLLTPKQQKIMEGYFYEDLSLGEIAEGAGISRQAVYDLLKRVEKTLEKYESKLHILERNKASRLQLQKALALLDAGGEGRQQEVQKILQALLDESR